MRVLFLVPHPIEGASSRYRVLQYIPHLEAQGISCTVSSFLSSGFYRIIYQKGRWGKKLGYFLVSTLRRLRDVLRSGRYDAVFVHLEAFPLGPPLIEWLLSLRHIPVVFDLDDAIFLPQRSGTNRAVNWLRASQKLPAILRWSRCVITCNDYLRDYVRQFNPNVYVIPTSVDTHTFVPVPTRHRQKPVIGWIGSHSTTPYLHSLKQVLRRVADRHAFALKVVGASEPFQVSGVDVIQEPWTLAKDVLHFQDLDVGVYPLPNDPWVLGKTGFKTVQYMAVGVPCVVSRVGRNCEIIEDGVNGFLAGSEDEWVQKLGQLLEDPALRRRLGAAGRKTVEERFSLHRQIPLYLEVLQRVTQKPVSRLLPSGLDPIAGQQVEFGQLAAGPARRTVQTEMTHEGDANILKMEPNA